MLHAIPLFSSVGSTSFWEQIATWYQNSTLGELILTSVRPILPFVLARMITFLSPTVP